MSLLHYRFSAVWFPRVFPPFYQRAPCFHPWAQLSLRAVQQPVFQAMKCVHRLPQPFFRAGVYFLLQPFTREATLTSPSLVSILHGSPIHRTERLLLHRCSTPSYQQFLLFLRLILPIFPPPDSASFIPFAQNQQAILCHFCAVSLQVPLCEPWARISRSRRVLGAAAAEL